MTHGYAAYANGCRCDTCRAAKATYLREERAERGRIRREFEAAYPSARFVAPWLRNHGKAYGYNNGQCRCWPCTDAKTNERRAS